MCQWAKDAVEVELPVWMQKEVQPHRVTLDGCMVGVIQALWDAGYETIGSCCGHSDGEPYVTVADRYDTAAIMTIAGMLKSLDGRRIAVKQRTEMTVEWSR